ncbi:Rv3235 family protein [Nocardioides stalactiti]|uniref:Rv3235 family protein n=1 Tax=Nocardioides stalactiti TaxID=2755356 RepID=UPI0016043AF7|nr:Rv3235 family protein [Nocardioides stalactiti]
MFLPSGGVVPAFPDARAPVPVAPVQGTLALALVPRCEPPAVTGTSHRGATVVPIDYRQRAVVEEWTRRFVQAAVEIVGGDRPVSQLCRWTTEEVHADLRRRAHLVARAGGHQPGLARVQLVRPRVLSVHTCFLGPDRVEVAVHVRYGERSRAVAACFERIEQRWICSALDFS